jgi:hypothetical protein
MAMSQSVASIRASVSVSTMVTFDSRESDADERLGKRALPGVLGRSALMPAA